ncbi:hypothetical protein BDR22DRAFT_889346 [Usnea florida]
MLLGQLHHYTTEKLPASPLPASQPAEDHCEYPYSTRFTVQIIIQTVVAYTPFSRKPTLSVFISAPISLLATASPVPIQAINGPRNSGQLVSVDMRVSVADHAVTRAGSEVVVEEADTAVAEAAGDIADTPRDVLVPQSQRPLHRLNTISLTHQYSHVPESLHEDLEAILSVGHSPFAIRHAAIRAHAWFHSGPNSLCTGLHFNRSQYINGLETVTECGIQRVLWPTSTAATTTTATVMDSATAVIRAITSADSAVHSTCEPQAKKEEEKEKPKPLYQATVEDAEDDAEDTPESTKHGNSMLTGSKSHDNKQLLRKWAPHTGLLATFLTTSLASSFSALFSRLATFFFGTFLASQLSYIRCMEEMEASGEG